MTPPTDPRAVFFGTPEWAVPSLDALIDSDWDIAAVVTNPDRPAGRGYELKPPPVKMRALEAGLEVQQPQRARDPEFAEWLRATSPDLCLVVAYGKILPVDILEIPRHGFVNLHFSLLPAYRGAAPVQRAIMEGQTTTGVSVMVLTEGMDEGPVLSTASVDIRPDETAGELGARLAAIGGPLLVDTVDRYVAGGLRPLKQEDSLATYAPKIDPDEARIEWSQPAPDVACKIRGLNPVPGAWTTLDAKRVKIHRAVETDGSGNPGEIVDVDELVVACGSGALVLEEVQPAGKRAMSGRDFARGLRPSDRRRFE